MLILASATDKLQVVTGAITMSVHASWLDNVTGAVSPGRTNTTITTGGTHDIVGSPAAGVFRNVKTLHVHNHGAAGNQTTIIHTDGTTSVELFSILLMPGDTLQYIDEIGFSVIGAAGDDVSNPVANLFTWIPTTVPYFDIGPSILSDPRFSVFELVFMLKHTGSPNAGLVAYISLDNGASWGAPGDYLQTGWVSSSGPGGGGSGAFIPANTQPYAYLCNVQATAQECQGRVTVFPGKDGHVRLKSQSSTWDPTTGSVSLYVDTMRYTGGAATHFRLAWNTGVNFFAGYGFVKFYGIR